MGYILISLELNVNAPDILIWNIESLPTWPASATIRNEHLTIIFDQHTSKVFLQKSGA